MREIETHKVEGKGGGADGTRILVTDQPGAGGANHHYVVLGDDPDEPLALVDFQEGPIQEHGVNGVQQEHLLAIVIDRLESFQRGPFANDYNGDALKYCKAALGRLQDRTRERMARGVEGFNKE